MVLQEDLRWLGQMSAQLVDPFLGQGQLWHRPIDIISGDCQVALQIDKWIILECFFVGFDVAVQNRCLKIQSVLLLSVKCPIHRSEFRFYLVH